MRQEDKEVDGPDLEQAEERKRETELVEEDDREVLDLDGKPYEMEKNRERSGDVVAAMKQILEGENIVINDLKLPQRELKALEALKTAKTAFSTRFACSISPKLRSIITALKRTAVGLARPLPAMSGAEPWTASYMIVSGPMFADPVTPRPPTRPETRSETMSP